MEMNRDKFSTKVRYENDTDTADLAGYKQYLHLIIHAFLLIHFLTSQVFS